MFSFSGIRDRTDWNEICVTDLQEIALKAENLAGSEQGSRNSQPGSYKINMHFRGFQGLEKLTLWAFPRLLVCLDCSFTQFTVSSDQVDALSESDSSRTDATDS